MTIAQDMGEKGNNHRDVRVTAVLVRRGGQRSDKPLDRPVMTTPQTDVFTDKMKPHLAPKSMMFVPGKEHKTS
jgi:hypothetical protein